MNHNIICKTKIIFQVDLALNYSKHFNEAFQNCFMVYDI